jgi:hypothetical protein
MDEVLWEKYFLAREAGKEFFKSEFFKIFKTFGKLVGDCRGISKTEDMANLRELWGYYCGYTS